ncbi:two-component regulator propeller domain-containing protein [Vitiosangium sp. GDMCC 1.1324]|uniref:two-component regulator propeller domain-containing protein n=1 Tax=Vitiosangium sp. (strain GDMCC 1.1324) TaxID=2138576 RepID=UPI00130DFFD8|nr:two-component regulator propeller domain-containing protein [Vitiosangium sp. GDMCC 1.1324]
MRRDGMLGLRVLAMAVLMGVWQPALALDPARRVTQYSHEAWKDEDGLPQNTVFSLAQTRDGYLWLATWEGMARFDGVHFTVYDKRNTPELRDEVIRAIAEDASGTLWVGSGRGLLVYREGRFHRMASGGPGEVEVFSLVPAAEGGLWVGAQEGLFHVRDGQTRRYGTAEGLPSEWVNALLVDHGGVVWAGTAKGLVRLSEGRVETVRLPGGVGRVAVRALLESHDGATWVGTDNGLVRLHEGHARLFTTRDGLPDDRVMALAEDRDGNLWVGTNAGGLVRMTEGSFSVFGPKQGLPGAGVLSLMEDREGSLWVGMMTSGLSRLRDAPFVTFGQPEGLRDELASVVLEDRQGAVWVGSLSGGLTRLKDGVLTHFGPEEGLAQENIRALAEDREGTLWVGTTGGAFRYDGRSFTRVGREQGLPDDVLFSLFADSRGGMWFGTARGLSRLHEGTFTAFGAERGGPAQPVVAVAEDSEGALWFGTFGGLYRLSGESFTRYTTADGLAGNRVLDVYADPRGGVWVATNTGLTLLRAGRFTRYTTAQGLYDDAVFRVLEDAEGHLWMSCNRGIFRVSRRELEEVAEGSRTTVAPIIFDRRDGMRSSECNGAALPSGWRARDGRLWFPTLRGVVSVDPARVVVHRPSAEPRLEEVRVQGRPVPLSGRLVLEPGQRDVEFRFTALSLEDSTRPPLRYRLRGHDADWVDAEDRRAVSYTHLPPGDYRFEVTAANRDAVWTEPGAVVELTVTPRFHQTLWFYALCVLGVGAVAGGVYALRVGRLKRRERWLEARVDERTRELAAANRELDENLRALRQAQSQLVEAGKMAAVGTLAAGVGHEINNPLAYIVSNLEYAITEASTLGRELPLGAPGRRRLEDIDRVLSEARHGADRVRRIVQDLKTFSRGDEEARGPVDLHAVLDSAVKLAGNELTPRARLVKEYGGESGWVDGNESRLSQVFLNLLINSAQALPEGQAAQHEIRLVTRRDGERVVAEVRDTGCGIPPEVMGRIFDPFFTTKPVGVGTGLGLALCHRFITAMGGEIAVESEPGKGTVVRVTLRAAAAPESPSQVVRPVQQEQESARVRGRVMIVDDDVMVSSALRRTLAREHDVEVMTSSRQALELLKGPKGTEVDVILCDLMMPDLTGMELHADLSAAAPGVARRMVFVTGGAFTPAARAFMDTVQNARVDKPFDPQKLREQVREWVAKART